MRDAPGNPQPAGLTLNVRCRGCVSCRKHRQVCFRQRAYAEYASAARSRFYTFTFRPSYHAKVDRKIAEQIKAELAVPSRYRTPDDVALLREILTAVRQQTGHLLAGKARRQLFALREAELGKEITLFLKRLRKRSGSKLRYALVAEAHTKALKGRPHFHMLMHEVDPACLVREKHIRGSWRLKVGFVSQKLTDGDSRAPAYLAKYLTKSDVHLRRVSKHYGGPRQVLPAPLRGDTPLGVGRSNAPVSSNDEMTPKTTSLPVPPEASPSTEGPEGPSLLRKFSLAETWDVGSGTDHRYRSQTGTYVCDAPSLHGPHPEGLRLREAAKAFKERRRLKQLH